MEATAESFAAKMRELAAGYNADFRLTAAAVSAERFSKTKRRPGGGADGQSSPAAGSGCGSGNGGRVDEEMGH